MDLKYIIWNYETKRIISHAIEKFGHTNCLKDSLKKPKLNGHPPV